MMTTACEHLVVDQEVSAKTQEGCEGCIVMGDGWVHLRLCLSCGHIGCCDSSKNMHATAHFHSTEHPAIKLFQPGEEWGWCYVDEVMTDRVS